MKPARPTWRSFAGHKGLSVRHAAQWPNLSPGLAPWKNGKQQGEGECISNNYLSQLRSLAEAGDARITLLNCGFEDMGQYVPDIAAETDLERHVARLRSIGAA